MNEDIYNENVNSLYKLANEFYTIKYFESLNKEINLHIETYCINDIEIKEYYKKQFELSKTIIQKEYKSFNIENLFKFYFKDSIAVLDKKSFEIFANNHLKIPEFIFLKKVTKNEVIEQSKNEIELIPIIENLFKEMNFPNFELIFDLSFRLDYFKHLLNEQKEIETNKMSITNLPNFELYQRYLVLDEILNIDYNIISLDTSKESKNKILSVLLQCSIDTAKDILNGSYKYRIRNIADKEDEVSIFIENLKIKKTKEV